MRIGLEGSLSDDRAALWSERARKIPLKTGVVYPSFRVRKQAMIYIQIY